MFRATVLPPLRSIRLYTTTCGMLYPVCCRSVIWWWSSSVTRSPTGNDGVPPSPDHRLAMTEFLCHHITDWQWWSSSVTRSPTGNDGVPPSPDHQLAMTEFLRHKITDWQRRSSSVTRSLTGNDGVPPSPDHRPTTYWVQHTTSCSVRSNAPEGGQNCCPKHVELIWIYQ